MRYTEIMVKLFCLFVFCGRISFVVEDVTFDPVSHTRFYRSRACPHCQVPIFFNWLENIHFPRKVTQVFYVIIKTELYCWAGLIMQVDICVTVTMLSWSPLNSLLLGDSSPHQAPLLESFTINATSKSHFLFFWQRIVHFHWTVWNTTAEKLSFTSANSLAKHSPQIPGVKLPHVLSNFDSGKLFAACHVFSFQTGLVTWIH